MVDIDPDNIDLKKLSASAIPGVQSIYSLYKRGQIDRDKAKEQMMKIITTFPKEEEEEDTTPEEKRKALQDEYDRQQAEKREAKELARLAREEEERQRQERVQKKMEEMSKEAEDLQDAEDTPAMQALKELEQKEAVKEEEKVFTSAISEDPTRFSKIPGYEKKSIDEFKVDNKPKRDDMKAAEEYFDLDNEESEFESEAYDEDEIDDLLEDEDDEDEDYVGERFGKPERRPTRPPIKVAKGGKPIQRPKPEIKSTAQLTLTDDDIDYVSKRITDKHFKDFYAGSKHVIDLMRGDGRNIVELAKTISYSDKPPLPIIALILFNHPLYDINKSFVLVRQIDPNTKMPIQGKMTVLEALDATKDLAEERYYDYAFNNFNKIIEQLLEDRRGLVSLAGLMELYLRDKQKGVFDINIPKESIRMVMEEKLEDTSRQMFYHFKKVVKQLKQESGEMQNIVDTNMSRFSDLFNEAVTRVLVRMKKEVEETSIEKVKRLVIKCYNPMYIVGGTSFTKYMLGVMVTDRVIELLVTEDFELPFKKYTADRLAREMRYKKAAVHVLNSIKELKAQGYLLEVEKDIFTLNPERFSL